MSWWVYSKDRRTLWAIDVDIMALIFVLGLGVTMVVPRLMRDPVGFMYVSTVLMAAGVLAVFLAKLSLFRRGIWVSWGPAKMTRGYANLYGIGYSLIGLGLVLLVLVISVVNQLGRVP